MAKWNPYTALLSKRYRDIFSSPLRRLFYRFIYSPYLNRGVIRTTNQAIESTQYYLRNIEQLPKSDYVEVTYENLCENPNDVIRSVKSFLGLEDLPETDYSKFVQPRQTDLLPEVKRGRHEVYEKLEAYFKAFGYTI